MKTKVPIGIAIKSQENFKNLVIIFSFATVMKGGILLMLKNKKNAKIKIDMINAKRVENSIIEMYILERNFIFAFTRFL
tara:strand:- start:37 stop:273 length:237 start_codon:yes stop_codon:yes gene_type:complete